jgi:hypothetical protein
LEDENFKEYLSDSKKYRKKPDKIPLSQRVIMLKREMKDRVDKAKVEELMKLKELQD